MISKLFLAVAVVKKYYHRLTVYYLYRHYYDTRNHYSACRVGKITAEKRGQFESRGLQTLMTVSTEIKTIFHQSHQRACSYRNAIVLLKTDL